MLGGVPFFVLVGVVSGVRGGTPKEVKGGCLLRAGNQWEKTGGSPWARLAAGFREG